MSPQPHVTIGVPSYNHAPFLPETIESVLGQTYPHIEIVIVDDGSTDDSLAIAQSYALKYPAKVQVHTHPGGGNRGISATVNECIKKSKGVYFSGLPSDDRLLPDKVEKQVAFLESHQRIGWVYGPARYIDGLGNKLPGKFGDDISHDAQPLEKLIIANRVPGMTVLARREYFEEIGAHTENLVYSDWEFWVRMASRHKVAFLRQAQVEYRLHNYNTSVGMSSQENFERSLAVMNSLRQNASRYGGRLDTPRTLALIELRRCSNLFSLGKREEAAESLRSVFETYPEIQNQPKDLALWLLASYEISPFYEWMAERLPAGMEARFRKKTTKLLQGLRLARTAVESYALGDFQKARQMAIRAQLRDPRWLFDRMLVSALTETLIGSPAMKIARQFKQ